MTKMEYFYYSKNSDDANKSRLADENMIWYIGPKDI